jgi:exopolysaccharide biosynthesis operon protein EpsL
LRLLCAALLAAGVGVPAGDALALLGDRLELFAGQGITYDSNPFRISDNESAATVIGSDSKSDIYYTTTAGFKFDMPVSRQRLEAGVTWDWTRYQDFDVLDFDGWTGQGIWHYQLGNDLSGQLGYTTSRALASLANDQAGLLVGTPNALDTRRWFLNAQYLLSARYQLDWEVSQLRQENSLEVRQVNDTTIDGAAITASYVTPAANKLGIGVHLEEGNFDNPQIVAGIPRDNSYEQISLAAVADLALTGSSRVALRTGMVTRSYESLGQRDFEDWIYNVTYDYRPGGALSMRAIVERAVNPLDDIYSTSVLREGFIIRPSWRPTEKLRIDGGFELTDRTYLGDPFRAVGLRPDRLDRVRAIGIYPTYRPLRTVEVAGALRHERRTSNIALEDYTANIIGVSARIIF